MNAVFKEESAGCFVTCLKSAGPRMTKRFCADGSVEGYENARNFTVVPRRVSNIRELSLLLAKLSTKQDCCAIRGEFVGDAEAQAIMPPERPGMYRRCSELFRDVARYWVCFDVDNWKSALLSDPAAAVEEFIQKELPECFHGASFHWQLSSSAGQVPGVLKCHIWFWLRAPYDSRQLKAWAKTLALPIDKALFNPVQAHYTANPVFDEGRVDPVPVRMGFCQGILDDEVDLIIPESVLASAGTEDCSTGDVEMPDPCSKPGLIGAVCRAWSITRVIEELLPDQFQFAAGSSRRVTWSGGRGAAEGCFVTDDDLHLGNKHDSDPMDNRLTNAFDLIRWYKFGELDQDLDLVTDVTSRPSYRAMLAWADADADVQREARSVAMSSRDALLAAVRGVETEAKLRGEVLPGMVSEIKSLSKADTDTLVLAIQARMREFTGVRVTVAIARSLLRESMRGGDEAFDRTQMPFWAKPWVYVTNGDVFLNTETKERQTKQGFDFSFSRYMAPFMDQDGIVPLPSTCASQVWQMDCVANVAYNPSLARIFEMSGLMYANTYTDASIPEVPPVLTDDEEEAIRIIERHAEMILPDLRERTLYLDWIAHNVKFPGKKIRWSPYLYGVPGAGKSFFAVLMEATMGPENVRPVSVETLIKSSFNEWANGSAVVVFEEVKLPDHSAQETDNKLKPLITNDTVSIHPKGAKAYSVPNVTNYSLFSNYGDGLPITAEDRRYMILASAITRDKAAELSESGYHQILFGAVQKHAGAVRKWLLERKLSQEFKPDGHAPMTEAKRVSIELCKSDTHNALEDVLKEGRIGVTQHVISSQHLSRAVKDITDRPVFTSTLNRMLTAAGFSHFGRMKWNGEACRVWVSASVASQLSGDESLDKTELRAALDTSKITEDFLK